MTVGVQTEQNEDFFFFRISTELTLLGSVLSLEKKKKQKKKPTLKLLGHQSFLGRGKHPSYRRNHFHRIFSTVKFSGKASLLGFFQASSFIKTASFLIE